MVRIVLVGGAGMETGVLAGRIEGAAGLRGIHVLVRVVSEAAVLSGALDADVVLLGPRLRYLEDRVATVMAPVPVQVVDMLHYECMDGDAVLTEAVECALLP